MKAISIKQPWASLIAHGIKDIENRTWKTNFRGRVYIHVSGKEAGSVLDLLNPEQFDEWTKYLNTLNKFPDKPVSAIIGEIDIVDCVINHPSIWAEKSENYSLFNPKGVPAFVGKKELKPIYNWVLSNPILYEKPILNVKGKLSFWDFDHSILKDVL